MRSGVSGLVRLECVIRPDGRVSDVRVIEPLDPTVDAEAVRVLKEWTFSPGLKDGKPVPVIVEVEMSFTMARGPRLGSSAVTQAGPGVVLPVAIESPKPDYPDAARQAGIRGSVTLDCVVLTDGSVGDVRVAKPLDRDLDALAIRTLRRWRFHPGTRDGTAVPVQVSVEMSFDLR
jgi:TonB family protein